jgi:FkbM family methyltransferase
VFTDLVWVEHEIGGIRVDTHEWPQRELLVRLLPPGGVFLDVGAHVGLYTLALAGKASRVVAVEPNPDAAAQLRANLALNDITNVDVLEAAAWDGAAPLNLSNPQPPTGEISGWMRTLPAEDGQIWGQRLDVALDLDRLDLVKVDVEGADLHALRGMSGLLHEHRPVLFVESHAVHGYYELGELTDLIGSLGYSWEEGPASGPAPFFVCYWKD